MSCIKNKSPNTNHASLALQENVGGAPMDSSWYTSPSVSSREPYITPLTSSTFESDPSTTTSTSLWGRFDHTFASGPIPDYNFIPQPLQSTTQFPSSQHPIAPSIFPTSEQSMAWTDNALGIYFDGQHQSDMPFPAYSSSTACSVPPSTTPYITDNLLHNQAHRGNQPTAATYSTSPEFLSPNPASHLASLIAKRRLDDRHNVELAVAPTGKRRRRTNSGPGQLTEEERLLLHLRETEQLQWKDIAARFTAVSGETRAVPTWQMQYHRLRKRLLEEKPWAKMDVDSLYKAHEWYETKKWEIITQKLLEQEVTENWTSDIVARKWQELQQPPATTLATPFGQVTPYASPRLSGDHGYGRMSV